MAKKRRLRPPAHRSVAPSADPAQRPSAAAALSLEPLSLALGLLGGTVVYVAYYPSDSVAVERGEGLWFALLCLVLATLTWARRCWLAGKPVEPAAAQPNSVRNRSMLCWSGLLDVIPWLLAIWMTIAALATSPPGNLRMATNEMWLWIAAASIFTAARRLLAPRQSRQAMLLLLIGFASASAVHGLHQHWISLPENRRAYQDDPEEVLRLARIHDAPEGSAERMIF